VAADAGSASGPPQAGLKELGINETEGWMWHLTEGEIGGIQQIRTIRTELHRCLSQIIHWDRHNLLSKTLQATVKYLVRESYLKNHELPSPQVSR
jgi:hypothetical protein